MVQVTDPGLDETVLDPACGTGGFLVESFDHLIAQVKTPEDRRILQRQSLFGKEAKPLPYMLSQMNLLLHGLEAPQIAYGNTLAQKLTDIGDRDRVDVILTNPPFGGEEEAGIPKDFSLRSKGQSSVKSTSIGVSMKPGARHPRTSCVCKPSGPSPPHVSSGGPGV
jgi:type I restriction enzyme M protein